MNLSLSILRPVLRKLPSTSVWNNVDNIYKWVGVEVNTSCVFTHTCSHTHAHIPKGDAFNPVIIEGSHGVKFNARKNTGLY